MRLPRWLDDGATSRRGADAARALPAEVDVVVIGAGLSGASCAFHLARDGTGGGGGVVARGGSRRPDVLLLEGRTQLAGGATGRNGGLLHAAAFWDVAKLARQHGMRTAVEYVLFERANRAALRRYCADRPDELERDIVALKLFDRAAPYDDALGIFGHAFFRAPLKLFGIDTFASPHAVRSALTLRAPPDDARAEREARAVRLRGAVDGIWAARIVRRLAAEAEAMGARVATGARVTSIVDEVFDPNAPCVVLTVEGPGVAGGRAQVRARRVVHCTNAAAPTLLPQLRGRIVPVRNHLIATAPLPLLAGTQRGGGGSSSGGCGFGVHPGWVYGSQRADGVVILGGFRNAVSSIYLPLHSVRILLTL